MGALVTHFGHALALFIHVTESRDEHAIVAKSPRAVFRVQGATLSLLVFFSHLLIALLLCIVDIPLSKCLPTGSGRALEKMDPIHLPQESPRDTNSDTTCSLIVVKPPFA